jgi:DNA-binding NarL/FixJ family response regulator
MDGITLLKIIRDKGINIPFIMFTITSKEKIISLAIESGVSSVIQKIGDPKTQYYELSKQIRQIKSDNKKSA